MKTLFKTLACAALIIGALFSFVALVDMVLDRKEYVDCDHDNYYF